ncbi:MAG: MmgE/PrpD family protein [Alphaproteobacteria bacterium]|nr:MmgE/PrpD family protein [Alphaproteobacteria bacterium]
MSAAPSQSVTRRLAAEIAETRIEAIPPAALAAMQRLLIDHVGITYMGAAFTGRALFSYARELGGRGEAVLIGDGVRAPAELAAGINSQTCRNTDFEETGPGTHVGPLCVHTALAVGQRVGASGRAVLAAATLGYALCARFHFARLKDWPRTSIVHHRTVAAAISARLLGYDATKTAEVLSLAWELPPRTHQAGGAAFIHKRISSLGLGSGIAAPLVGARMGVQAATMVGHGFVSVGDEIDHHLEAYDRTILVEDPIPFHHVDGEMELKPWVASRHSQCGLQAIANLVREQAIDPHRVSAIRLHLSNMYTAQQGWLFEPAPANYWEAIYSTQWAAAMVLQDVPAGPKWFTPARLADPLTRKLAAMVEIVEDPESSKAYWGVNWLDIRGTAEITVGGKVHRARCTMRETYGSPRMDMTEAMVEQKFLESTSTTLPTDRARRLLALLRRLEEIRDVNEIAAAM